MADGNGGDGAGQSTGEGASVAQSAEGAVNSTQQNDGNQEGSEEAQAVTAEATEAEASEKQSETDIKISKLYTRKNLILY